MALFDHFAPDAGDAQDGGNGFHRISANGFMATLSMGLNGAFGDEAAARQFMVDEFNLDEQDGIQLDEILVLANTGSLVSPATNKRFRDTRDAIVAYEGGHVTKLQAENNAGVTPS